MRKKEKIEEDKQETKQEESENGITISMDEFANWTIKCIDSLYTRIHNLEGQVKGLQKQQKKSINKINNKIKNLKIY